MDPQPGSGEEAGRITQAVQGDVDSWASLLRAHHEAVFRFAYLLLGDPDEAEDVAQETFIKAHRALPRFDLNRPLRPWLLKIAANQAKNRRRSIGRYWRALKRFAQQEPVENPRRLSIDEDKTELWEAIQQLPPIDQQVIYLRYFFQMSVAEASQALDVPEGTVKSRCSRALQRLKNLIESHYPDLRRV